MTRVALYARFSSDLQREASIADQLRVCEARAEREGWQVVEVCSDFAISGSSMLRPGYQALLELVRRRQVDVVLAESLDRLSRDQEHIAAFYKQARFAGVRIVTLSEGEVSEMAIGFKGTMGAVYLRDLADKTRRGLEGRIRQGRSGGGNAYGYKVVRGPVGRDGEAERGLREIDPAQAAVVRRIFQAFAAGTSPIALARLLNEEQIAGPRGGIWCAGSIRGQAARETGILRNRLYVGELVWNKRTWAKDPDSGRRRARANDAGMLVTESVPDLRIIDQELWERAQARLEASARPECSPVPKERPGSGGPDHLWHHRRPVHLLSGKVVCGGCGAAFTPIGRDYLACKVAMQRGGCDNQTRIRRSQVEAQTLEALGSRLMQPELVAVFVAEFTATWNTLRAQASSGLEGKRRELAAVERQLAGLIQSLIDGFRAPGLQGRLDELEARKQALLAEVGAVEQGPALPRLHPNLAEVYRGRVEQLRQALAVENGPEALEAARALIDRVEVHAPAELKGPPRLELVGHLAAMLRAAGFTGVGSDKSPSAVADGLGVLLGLGLGDAGTGFEPVTFRL